ncbi:MAG: ATP-dependent 6-phosphofructokinase [Candidatus Omnitrophica bacterium]|nr:ATP-dependent 6-phosphofructokinase [Candidatus Omnitrophota bacterium]
MKANVPRREDLESLSIARVGEPTIESPLKLRGNLFTDDSDRVVVHADSDTIGASLKEGEMPPMFEAAGPRKKIFFDPASLTCGIVTCGGLCPGLNDVVRSITLTLLLQYGVKKVLGFRYGYGGLSANADHPPMELTPDVVDGIQHKGGTILGTSRGMQEPAEMVETLLEYDVRILFVVGGDGTFKGAHRIAAEIKKRGLTIAVVGVPKTIDNDIYGSESSFGFGTAVDKAREAIASAHEEARAAFNGIGLVKVMGRDSGFIAACSSLANSDVNFCLIPESPFRLEGDDGLLRRIETRLARKHHAVIVAAEGAGQGLLKETHQKDAAGNVIYADIGLFLKGAISEYLSQKNISFTIKYIDPSYTIRSCPANARDSIFCLLLAEMAVHAGMAGKTDMFVGYWNQHFTNMPLSFAVNKRKKLDTNGPLWQTLLAITSEK